MSDLAGRSTHVTGAGSTTTGLCAENAEGEAGRGRTSQPQAVVQEMEEGAGDVRSLALRINSAREDSKPCKGRLLRAGVFERCRKRGEPPGQVCTTELSESEPSMTRRKSRKRHQNRARPFLGQAWRGYLALGQSGVRLKGGKNVVAALVRNSGTSRVVVPPEMAGAEYAEAESRRRSTRIRRTGADCGVVAMKGL